MYSYGAAIGMIIKETLLEEERSKGVHFRLEWLHMLFVRHSGVQRFDVAARAYTLHLKR